LHGSFVAMACPLERNYDDWDGRKRGRPLAVAANGTESRRNIATAQDDAAFVACGQNANAT